MAAEREGTQFSMLTALRAKLTFFSRQRVLLLRICVLQLPFIERLDFRNVWLLHGPANYVRTRALYTGEKDTEEVTQSQVKEGTN